MNSWLAVFTVLVFLALAPAAIAAQTGAQWQFSVTKYTPTRYYSGHCPGTQCLLEKGTIPAEKICVNNTEFRGDYYCNEGNWTTRTKLVASQLLKFVKMQTINIAWQTNYSIFCDSKEKVFVSLPSGFDNVYGDSFNSFCLLRYGNKFGFGTSLNGIGAEDAMAALNITVAAASCPILSSANPKQFSRCGTSNVFFNPSINSTIYLPEVTSISPEDIPLAAAVLSYIFSPYLLLRNFIMQTQFIEPSELVSPFTNTRLFNKLYLSKTPDSVFFAFYETNQYEYENEIPIEYEYLGINYTNLPSTIDVCTIFSKANTAITTDRCNSVSGNFVIGSKNGQTKNFWQDLTAKLRPT